jgi:hypothetical protein
MPAMDPISASPIAGTVWEVQAGADAIFGTSPFEFAPGPPTVLVGSLVKNWYDYMRATLMPFMTSAPNSQSIDVVYRTLTASDMDPLSTTSSEIVRTVKALIHGPSVASLQQGVLTIAGWEVIIAAADLPNPPSTDCLVRWNGVEHSVVFLRPIPEYPMPIAYHLGVKRA